MTTKNPKVYIAKRGYARITYRALDTFELKNPKMFNLTRSAHDTWEAAHAWLLAEANETLKRAQAQHASAVRHAAKVLDMPKPKEASDDRA